MADDNSSLRDEIKKARAAEMKAKTQIYTMRGKKGLQAMAAQMGEELPEHLSSKQTIYDDPEDSPQIQELRRQLALIKEMEKQQRDQIEELKAKKASREANQTTSVDLKKENEIEPENEPMMIPQVRAMVMEEEAPIQPESSISLQKEPEVQEKKEITPVQEVRSPSVAAAPTPATVGPPPTPVAAVVPSGPKTTVTKGKNGKLVMGPPALITKVLNASWDSGSAKSKKNNKVYTIQVSVDAVTWKIIRGDDALADLSKRLGKVKAEAIPLPALVKKVVKREQQGELGAEVEKYLNQIQAPAAFAPKKDKAKAAFLKFFTPFSSRDEGMGNFPGNTSDTEGWFIWKLGLA